MLILLPFIARPEYHQHARLGGTAHGIYRTGGHSYSNSGQVSPQPIFLLLPVSQS